MNAEPHSSADSIDDSRVNEIVAEYLAALDAGQVPDRAALVARQPDLAAELIECFADLDRIGLLAEPLQPPRAVPRDGPDNATPFGEPLTMPLSSPERADAEPPCGRIGDYELIEEVARGGMGVVFKARQVSLNRIVAVKMVLAGQFASGSDVIRFRAEAEAAARLQHPNIVAIHEVGEHDGQHFFSMDFVDGPSLTEIIREQPLPPRDAAALLKTLAEAVQYAHEKGVVHRDLKPSNVLMERRESSDEGREPECPRRETSSSGSGPSTLDPRPRITDFGLAKRIEGGSDLTGTGQILGTPSYMPPEQAAGRNDEIGPASDVYSLGAILYESVSGRPPFRAQSPLDTLVQVLETEPVPLRLLNPAVPRDLETIAMKCLQKDSRRRYATAGELADDLRRFLAGEPIRARAVSRVERAWRWCRRRPGWAAMIGVSVAALLLITAGSVWFSGRLRQQLARTEEKQHELEIALARQVAERLDSDLRQLAAVPRGLALLLAERSDWTETQIDETLRGLIESDPRIFGICVALEPYTFDASREHFARYVSRRSNQTDDADLKFLHPPHYELYRGWDWYRLPQQDGRPRWSEPYLDTGGGNIPMVTFSVPFQRDGRFAGVVTADLSLAYFRQLKTWLDELKLARGDYGFVISPAGTFISDANSDYQMGKKLSDFARPEFDPGYTALLTLVQRKEPGAVKGRDFWSGEPCTFLVAPVTSSGWSFVAVVPDQSFLSSRSAPIR